MRRATADQHPWYELQQPQEGVFHLFTVPKVMWPNIARSIRFAWDEHGHYPDMTAFFTTRLGPEHVALLNSEVGEFLICMLTNRVRGGFVELKQDYLFSFPIPEISRPQMASLAELCFAGMSETQPSDFEARLTDEAAKAFGIGKADILLIQQWLAARSMS